MKVLSRLVKVLSLLSLTLSILVNIGLGIVIFYIVRIVKYGKKIAELKTTGTRVMATVTGIDTLNTHGYSFSGSSRPTRVPRKAYFLVATWQHPQTGKTYTFRAPIMNRDKFPIGSPVPFLVDYNHPRWHCLEDMLGAFTRSNDEPPPAED
jgi:hypothetical protein